MFDGSSNIMADYGPIGADILSEFDNVYLENEDYVFTFRHLYPALGTFQIYQGAKRLIGGENPEEKYYWTLVSVSNKSDLNANIDNMRNDTFNFILIAILLNVIVMILLFLVLVMNWTLE